MSIIKYENIGSTNDEAQKLFTEGKAAVGDIIIADQQSDGHGRIDRSFTSPVGGLYMSVICPADMDIPTVRAAVAVNNVLKQKFAVDTKIKWVNDILLNSKKVCGILAIGVPQAAMAGADPAATEMAATVIGIGLNLSSQDFFEELDADFIDTGLEAGSAEFFALRDELAEAIAAAVTDGRESHVVLDEYTEDSALLNKHILVYKHGLDKPPMEAIPTGFDSTGAMKVKYVVKARHGTSGFEGGRETLRNASISIRLRDE